jgi:hypothetical protein
VDVGNLGRIAFCRLWMELDDIRAGRQCELGLHCFLACLHLVQAIAHTWRAPPVLDLTDQPLNLAADLSQLAFKGRPDLCGLAREALALDAVSLNRRCDYVRFEQVLLERGENTSFDFDRGNVAAIVAAVPVDSGRAAEVGDVVAAVTHDHASTAATAYQQS